MAFCEIQAKKLMQTIEEEEEQCEFRCQIAAKLQFDAFKLYNYGTKQL